MSLRSSWDALPVTRDWTWQLPSVLYTNVSKRRSRLSEDNQEKCSASRPGSFSKSRSERLHLLETELPVDSGGHDGASSLSSGLSYLRVTETKENHSLLQKTAVLLTKGALASAKK